MALETKFHRWIQMLSIGSALIAAPSAFAQTAVEAPRIVHNSVDHGSIQPLAESTVTVHLKLHNEAAFDKAVDELYTAGSPTYHHWMTASDFAKYAPAPAEIETVKKELASHGLAIVSVDANNYSIRARGTAVNFERAFQTQIHELERDGKTFQANIAPAVLTGKAGNLVKGVTGLTSFRLEAMNRQQVNPRTGNALPTIPVQRAKSVGLADLFTNSCFRSPEALTLTTLGAALPVGQYYGNQYNQLGKVCGWTPAQMQTHYGLNNAYNSGFDGKGQTIVILAAPTDPSVAIDFAAFSQLTGLPPVTSSNFQIIYPDGKPSAIALANQNATVESALDIEWAHAIAPKAKIILEILPTQDWTEFEYAIQYTVANKLGNVISISYGLPEGLFGAYTVAGFEQSLKTAAAAGIAVNISSGDSGDAGTGVPNGGGESYPAASAYATSIGGTSIGLPGPKAWVEAGWGNNETLLSFAPNAVLDPPLGLGFYAGSGGGESIFISKPSWQKTLPGAGRQQPDISADADPFTGAIIVAGGQVGVIGGTSLAAPVFSGMWTLADQKAGKSLGQAAPLLPSLLSTIKDIVPFSSATNPAGTIFDQAGASFYSAANLIPPLYTTTSFFSTLWDGSGAGLGEYVDLSFGTDTSLTVTSGWDNVTGYGVPLGSHFVYAAAALK